MFDKLILSIVLGIFATTSTAEIRMVPEGAVFAKDSYWSMPEVATVIDMTTVTRRDYEQIMLATGNMTIQQWQSIRGVNPSQFKNPFEADRKIKQAYSLELAEAFEKYFLLTLPNVVLFYDWQPSSMHWKPIEQNGNIVGAWLSFCGIAGVDTGFLSSIGYGEFAIGLAPNLRGGEQQWCVSNDIRDHIKANTSGSFHMGGEILAHFPDLETAEKYYNMTNGFTDPIEVTASCLGASIFDGHITCGGTDVFTVRHNGEVWFRTYYEKPEHRRLGYDKIQLRFFK